MGQGRELAQAKRHGDHGLARLSRLLGTEMDREDQHDIVTDGTVDNQFTL